MRGKVRAIFQIVIGIILVVSICAVEGSAQKRKRRTRKAKPAAPRPVITNPDIAPPAGDSTGDVKIISTAEEGEATGESPKSTKPKTATSTTTDPNIQQTITTLSNQVNKLNDKLTKIQEDERDQLEMERLTRAEQRAEQVRSQLIDVQSKIADFEAKLDLIEYSLKPENIERSTQTGGSVHPEEAREARKRQLENERGRVQAQLKILETSKTRLEVSVGNADSEVDLLRAKLNQRRQQQEAGPIEPRPQKPDPN